MLRSYIQPLRSTLQSNFSSWIKSSFEQQSDSVTGKFKTSALLKLLNSLVGKSIPFGRRNKFTVMSYRPGHIKALIPLKPNKNHFNVMYAGALFTVAELPPGILTLMSFDDRFYPILKDLKMEFLTMAKSDVTVEFEMPPACLAELKSEAIKNGKCAFSLVGELKDINNVVVAKSYANYQVRTRTK